MDLKMQLVFLFGIKEEDNRKRFIIKELKPLHKINQLLKSKKI